MAKVLDQLLLALTRSSATHPFLGMRNVSEVTAECRRIRALPPVMSGPGVEVYLDEARGILWADTFSCGVASITGAPLGSNPERLLPLDCDPESCYHASPHRSCILR